MVLSLLYKFTLTLGIYLIKISLQAAIAPKTPIPGSPLVDKDFLNYLSTIGRRVAVIKNLYANLQRHSKLYKCYNVSCDSQGMNGCYSPVCRHRNNLRRELLLLLRRANTVRGATLPSSSPSKNMFDFEAISVDSTVSFAAFTIYYRFFVHRHPSHQKRITYCRT